MQQLLTTDEVATRLKLHPNTVTRYITEGKLKATKVGKGYRFTEAEVTCDKQRNENVR